MKLPTPIMGDRTFHTFMIQLNATEGLISFVEFHVEALNKLKRMKEKLE